MGAAAIGIALWRYEMRYNPLNPDWFNRDREHRSCSIARYARVALSYIPSFHPGFVLSAGHACLFQYIFLHFAGYEAWTMDQIKMYHSPATTGSMAAGHPEIEYPGQSSRDELVELRKGWRERQKGDQDSEWLIRAPSASLRYRSDHRTTRSGNRQCRGNGNSC
jgi:hypothetical protein